MNGLIEQFQENVNISQNQTTNVYMWGSAECDQFDLKDTNGEEQPECKRPYNIQQFFKQNFYIINIACGGLHTIFLTNQGQVYASGCNDDLTLGKSDDSISDRIPTLVDLPIRVNMISAGNSHSVAANSQESIVYFWGVYKNTNGNMQNPMQKPTRIGGELFQKPISKLLSGYNHTMVLMDKKVYCWGDPDTKVLGRKSITRQCIQSSLKPEALGISNILDVFTGGYHSFVKVQKKFEGVLQNCFLAWGLNNYGQLGIGSTEDALIPQEIQEFRGKDIIQIVGGEHHTLALDHDGDVYSFGRNDDGQIGLGEELNEELKKQAQIDRNNQLDDLKQKSQKIIPSQKKQQKKLQQNIMFLESGRVIGYEYVTKPQKIETIQQIDEIIAAGHYSYAVSLAQQKFYSWGLGSSYVLGTREEDSVFEPYQINKQFFKNERVLKISLGGQHVSYISIENDQDFKIKEIDPQLLKVDELIKLPKIKNYRKLLPLKEDEQLSSNKSSDHIIEIKGRRKKREVEAYEEPVPQSKLKIE